MLLTSYHLIVTVAPAHDEYIIVLCLLLYCTIVDLKYIQLYIGPKKILYNTSTDIIFSRNKADIECFQPWAFCNSSVTCFYTLRF